MRLTFSKWTDRAVSADLSDKLAASLQKLVHVIRATESSAAYEVALPHMLVHIGANPCAEMLEKWNKVVGAIDLRSERFRPLMAELLASECRTHWLRKAGKAIMDTLRRKKMPSLPVWEDVPPDYDIHVPKRAYQGASAAGRRPHARPRAMSAHSAESLDLPSAEDLEGDKHRSSGSIDDASSTERGSPDSLSEDWD